MATTVEQIDEPIVKHARDPVYVVARYRSVELRIGYPSPGETRYAYVSIREARRIAYALLAAAEDVAERRDKAAERAKAEQDSED